MPVIAPCPFLASQRHILMAAVTSFPSTVYGRSRTQSSSLLSHSRPLSNPQRLSLRPPSAAARGCPVSCTLARDSVRAAVQMEAEPSLLLRPDPFGRFGKFGGKYVPETLMYALSELEAAFHALAGDQDFQVSFFFFSYFLCFARMWVGFHRINSLEMLSLLRIIVCLCISYRSCDGSALYVLL